MRIIPLLIQQNHIDFARQNEDYYKLFLEKLAWLTKFQTNKQMVTYIMKEKSDEYVEARAEPNILILQFKICKKQDN